MEGGPGNLYVDPSGVVVENEEIGKMGRWPIQHCELTLQFVARSKQVYIEWLEATVLLSTTRV
jgi:hypothetical protein